MSPASMHNTPSMVGWSAEPFVAISFNYRIGALGFLPSSITADEGLLNLGLHDQLLLLQWVQDNVERFGGDPSQVTLFGLSAGAHSIAHHITNPALTNLTHNRLFHRAIIESGSALSRVVHPPNAQLHEDQFHAFVAQAGCPTASTPDIMPCLRRQPSSTITAAQLAVFDHWNPSVRWAFQPVIDGELIMRPPIETWRSQSSSQNANSKTWTWTWPSLPILTGFNSNEGTYYVPCSLNTSDSFAAFFRSLLPAYSDADIAAVEALYPDPAEDKTSPYTETRENLDIGTQFKRVEAAYGHYAYACPVRLTARLAAERQEQEQDAPVFLYRWALNKTVLGGANHGDQMEYETFDARVRGISRAQEEVAGRFHAYLTSFIVTGDPNAVKGIDRPVWERYEGDGRIMVFGEGNDERAGGDGVGVAAQMSEDDWGRRECAFWWEKAGISD